MPAQLSTTPMTAWRRQDIQDWLTQDPHRVWNSNLTIVDYLTEFHSLLNNGDYIGI